MRWRQSLLLGFKNLGRRRFRSAVAILVVAVGTAAVLVVWGVVTGQRRALVGQAVSGAFGALQVHAPGYRQARDMLPVKPSLRGVDAWSAEISAVPGVAAVSPRWVFGALISEPDERGGASTSISVVAFEEARERAVMPEKFRRVVRGSMFTQPASMVLSAPLANGLRAVLGAEPPPALVARDAEGLLNGAAATVTGVVAPMLPTDRASAWVPLPLAQELLRAPDEVNEFVVAIHDDADLHLTRDLLQRALGTRATVETWEDQLPALADLVANMKISALMLSFIVSIVGALAVFATAALNVKDRTREIGTWLALGARRSFVLRSFLMESACCAAIGIAIGVACGLVGAVLATRTGIDMRLPGTDVTVDVAPSLHVRDVLTVSLGALGASLIGAWVPARRAARLTPVEALADT